MDWPKPETVVEAKAKKREEDKQAAVARKAAVMALQPALRPKATPRRRVASTHAAESTVTALGRRPPGGVGGMSQASGQPPREDTIDATHLAGAVAAVSMRGTARGATPRANLRGDGMQERRLPSRRPSSAGAASKAMAKPRARAARAKSR